MATTIPDLRYTIELKIIFFKPLGFKAYVILGTLVLQKDGILDYVMHMFVLKW